MSYRSPVQLRRLLAALAIVTATPAILAAMDIVVRGRAYANQTRTHYFTVGSTSYVTVRGDGDTDLDCWIYDANGRIADSDTDSTDYCILATPGYGRHRLVIRNYGSVYNDYVVSRE